MNSSLDPHAIAREVIAAQDQNLRVEPFTARLAGFDNNLAYQVADIVHEARIGSGALPVGRKIGFTNPEMWTLYGVREPAWAYVYDRTVMHIAGGSARCSLGGFAEPKIEPEIVIHFHSTPQAGSTASHLLSCVDWIAHGIEVVQSHFQGWKFQAADTIADSVLHARLLVGQPQNLERLGPDVAADLEQFIITLSCDGSDRERGTGANVLGSPLAAVAHLLDVLARQPGAAPLQGGELVTTGTLTPALPIQPGQCWTTRISGIALPGLSVTFEQ